LARLHRESLPRSPSQLNPEIPPALDQIILKVLSKEPSARYRTADQMGRVLITFSQAAHPPAVPAQPADSPTPEPSVEDAGSITERFFDIDWVTVGLGLLAVVAVGGLIPFWLAIWFYLNPISR